MKQTNNHSSFQVGDLVRFQVGDLVRVRDGTHDPAMAQSRTGLIVEVVALTGRYAAPGHAYMVQFGASILKFHPMFLEKVS